jgi:hypothetical protein
MRLSITLPTAGLPGCIAWHGGLPTTAASTRLCPSVDVCLSEAEPARADAAACARRANGLRRIARMLVVQPCPPYCSASTHADRQAGGRTHRQVPAAVRGNAGLTQLLTDSKSVSHVQQWRRAQTTLCSTGIPKHLTVSMGMPTNGAVCFQGRTSHSSARLSADHPSVRLRTALAWCWACDHCCTGGHTTHSRPMMRAAPTCFVEVHPSRSSSWMDCFVEVYPSRSAGRMAWLMCPRSRAA